MRAAEEVEKQAGSVKQGEGLTGLALVMMVW